MEGRIRRRHLPHWDVDGAPYFVTSCLAESIPASGMREINQYRLELARRRKPEGLASAEWDRRKHKLLFARIDEILDYRPAVRHFERSEMATIVRDSINHFDGVRYQSIAWSVMPSHFHWLFQPLPEWSNSLPKGRSPREVIMHSVKSFSANQCNKITQAHGQFWQDESYDHWIRDEEEMGRVIDYIEFNPVKAGLSESPEEFEFCSAYERGRITVG
jgi:type I restriction enzyme R subunit